MKTETKRKYVLLFDRRLQRPVVSLGHRLGVPMPPPWGVLLETTGRKTGNPHRTPVAKTLIGDELWVFSEHGYAADWLRNVKANPRVRVKMRRGWQSGTATILDDDDAVERTRIFARELKGWHRLDPLAPKLFWTGGVTVRIDLDRVPAG